MIYFDPTTSLYLSRDPSFDGVGVEVDESVVDFLEQFTTLLLKVQGDIYEAGATEDYAQVLASNFVTNLRELLDAQSNS